MHIQEAIAGYFGEDPESNNTPKRDSIMQWRYWKGQVHGDEGRTPAHSRHLHPLFAAMTSGKRQLVFESHTLVTQQQIVETPKNSQIPTRIWHYS